MFVDVDFDKAASIHKNIAIEFTNYSIRIMQLENTGGGVKVRAFSEVEISRQDVQDGVIINPESVANKIIEALQTSKPGKANTNYVICLIPQRHTFITTSEFPTLDKKELKDIVLHKAGEIIPLPLDEVYWDWHRLADEGREERMTKVQFAAVSRRLIDSYMQTLQLAKLEPLLFEPSATAANRLHIRNRDKESHSSTILVNVAGDYSVLSLAQDRGVLFSTQVMLDTKQDAERANILYRKIIEISRYAQVKLKAGEETNVTLYGLPTRVASILPILKEVLGEDKVSQVEYKNDGQILQFITKQRIDNYIPLIGAGIRGLSNYTEGSSLNLIPQVAKDVFTRREMLNRMRGYLSFLAIDIALVALALLLVSFQVDSRLKHLNDRYESIVSISNSSRISEIAGSIDGVNETTGQFKQLIEQTYDWQKLFDLLNANTPKSITITNLTVAPEINGSGRASLWNVRLSGNSTSDRDTVISYLDGLRSTGILEEVKLPIDNLETSKNVSFTVEAIMSLDSLKYESTEE